MPNMILSLAEAQNHVYRGAINNTGSIRLNDQDVGFPVAVGCDYLNSKSMKVISAKKFEEQQRRTKYIVIGLFVVFLLGASFVLYNYLQVKGRVSIPKDLNQVELMVKTLEKEGLVLSFNPATAEMKVDETIWQDKSADEKMGMVLQIAKYCASRNKSTELKLKVIGNRTSGVVAEMGSSGIRIYR